MFQPDYCMDCGVLCNAKRPCQCCVDLEAARKTWERWHEERRAGDE